MKTIFTNKSEAQKAAKARGKKAYVMPDSSYFVGTYKQALAKKKSIRKKGGYVKTDPKMSALSGSKKKLATQGSQIMKIAKQISKANPRKKWTTCVKEAGKKWKKTH